MIPDWIPYDAWQGFLDMRKKMRRPMTDYAMKLAIKKLDELRAQGNDPQAVLDQSILNGWQGLFAVRDSQPMQCKFDPIAHVNRNRR